MDKAVLLSYHPKIQVDFYINHSQNYGEDKPYLELLDAFLKNSQIMSTLKLPFSVNERSYQIFCDKENQRTLHDDVELFFREEILKEDKKELEQQGKYFIKHLIIATAG